MAGSSITQMALPVLAVLHLDATTAQVAWLAFLGQLPPALLALHAGALADRYSKRRQMITGDLVSAAVLATVPVTAALGTLTLTQLMIVAVVQGTASVLHDAAAISLLPGLVDRSMIQRSNSRVGTLFAIAATGGSHLGAVLTAMGGPARALLGDVASYLISAGCTARIQAPGLVRARPETRRLRDEIGEGLRYVYGDDRLRTLTLVNATTSFALGLLNTLWALYLLRALAMSATAFGVVLGLGALGAAAGALAAPALARRYGPGPMMMAALAITPLTQLALLLALPRPSLADRDRSGAVPATGLRRCRRHHPAIDSSDHHHRRHAGADAGREHLADIRRPPRGRAARRRPRNVDRGACHPDRRHLPAARPSRHPGLLFAARAAADAGPTPPPHQAQPPPPCSLHPRTSAPVRPCPGPHVRKSPGTTTHWEAIPREQGAERGGSAAGFCCCRAPQSPGVHRAVRPGCASPAPHSAYVRRLVRVAGGSKAFGQCLDRLRSGEQQVDAGEPRGVGRCWRASLRAEPIGEDEEAAVVAHADADEPVSPAGEGLQTQQVAVERLGAGEGGVGRLELDVPHVRPGRQVCGRARAGLVAKVLHSDRRGDNDRQALVGPLPLLLRTGPGHLDHVAVGIGHVARLAHDVVARVDVESCVQVPLGEAGHVRLGGHERCEVAEPGAGGRRRDSPGSLVQVDQHPSRHAQLRSLCLAIEEAEACAWV
ncbi:MFS transporter [Streptomyces lydicus]|nr:MFS transporter [Streptomyces lydicus]